VVGTHANLAGRDMARAGGEVSDALTGDLKAVKVRDTPALVGRGSSASGDVDRTRNAAVAQPGAGYDRPPARYPAPSPSPSPSASHTTYPDAPSSLSSSSRGRPFVTGSTAATTPAVAFKDADAVDRAAMAHVPQVEDALGESAMAINAVEGPGAGALRGTQASLHYGARDGGYDAKYGPSARYGSPDDRYAAAAGLGSGPGASGVSYSYGARPGVSDRAANARDIVHDHAVSARTDVRQAKRELSDIGGTHAELMKRDASTAGSELKQALTGDTLPGAAVVRDTPDLTRQAGRDVARAQPTSSTWSPATREAPSIVDRVREAKDIVKAHGSAAVEDVKQWGHEVKEVVAGHGSAARTDVSNAAGEVKDASRGAIAPAAPLRTPAITAEEEKRF